MPWQPHACCPVCAATSFASAVCGTCLKAPPAFDATIAVMQYQYPLNVLLHAYKYGEQLPLATLLGGLLADKVAHVTTPDILLAMPLHPERLKERGFNQAVELARVIARRKQVSLALDVCRRVRVTLPQGGLPLAERTKNLRAAFACDADVSGKRIAIVDDVMTSGASLNELAKTLKKSGAVEVSCWVVARTQTDH